jgi:hypothetical protein
VSKPDSASHWLIDWRMSCSSSTIAIFIAASLSSFRSAACPPPDRPRRAPSHPAEAAAAFRRPRRPSRVARGQAPAEVGHDPRRNGKPQPHAVAGLLGGVEGLEQRLEVLDPVPLSRTVSTASSPAAIRMSISRVRRVLHRVERVAQQVDDHLFQPHPVAHHHDRTAGRFRVISTCMLAQLRLHHRDQRPSARPANPRARRRRRPCGVGFQLPVIAPIRSIRSSIRWNDDSASSGGAGRAAAARRRDRSSSPPAAGSARG